MKAENVVCRCDLERRVLKQFDNVSARGAGMEQGTDGIGGRECALLYNGSDFEAFNRAQLGALSIYCNVKVATGGTAALGARRRLKHARTKARQINAGQAKEEFTGCTGTDAWKLGRRKECAVGPVGLRNSVLFHFDPQVGQWTLGGIRQTRIDAVQGRDKRVAVSFEARVVTVKKIFVRPAVRGVWRA